MNTYKKILSIVLLITLTLTSMTGLLADEAFPQASGWAIRELQMAKNDGFITTAVSDDFSKNITREDFCEIAVILYDRLGGKQNIPNENPFTDTSNPIIIKAYNAGIITGIGNNLFAPDNNLTRQELCVMIIRAMMKSGIVFGAENEYTFQKSYADEEKIAQWAYTQVKIMNDFKIMNGSGDQLDPLSTLTVEQSLIMLERAFLRDFTIEDGSLIAYLGKSSDVTIPNGVISINDDAMHTNDFITKLTLPSTLKTIGGASFREMSVLQSVTFNEGLTLVGEAAFELCEQLESITLPSTLETISFMSFQDCSLVTSIDLPASVMTIDDQAFYRCSALERFTFNNTSVTIGSNAFELCDKLIFVCEDGSTAHQYAIENNIAFELK